MPREQQRVLGLILEEPRLVDDRDQRARHVLADLVRPLHFDDAGQDFTVEADVVDQRACARGSADAEDARPLGHGIAQQRVQRHLRLCDPAPELLQALVEQLRPALLGDHRLHGRLHTPRAEPCGVDADRSAVRRNPLRVHDLQSVHAEQIGDAHERVVAQVLVVNRVVLQRLDERHQIVRLGDEHAVGRQHREHAVDDLVDAFDVREDVRRGDDLRNPAFPDDAPGDGGAEKAHDRPDAPLVREIGHQRRLDPADRMSRRAEVLEQRAVVRSHVDDELRSFEAQERGRLALQLREVLAQDLRRAARVRVLGRKQNSRIDNQPELHQLTRSAA